MTPEQWTALRREEEQRHCKAMKAINDQWDSLEFPPLEVLRPCLADDIRAGRVIYYPNNGDDRFWREVAEPLYYGDDFKAYTAADGCRYGLRGAFVRISDREDA